MAFAGVGRTAVCASRSLARPTRRRLRALVVVVAPGHWSGAARCVLGQWPAASHVVCAPAHPCASPLRGSALRAGLPVRPQGAPSAQRKGARRLTAAGRQPHFCGANPCNDALVLRPLRGRLLENELT